ncbi:MAG: GNAT family N-acetyltransferase [Planctomycetaceae bacterium]
MTSPTVQTAPKRSLPVWDRADQLIVRPLHEMMAEFRDSLKRLYEQTPNPHPYLHPGCLQAHFAETGTDVWVAAVQHDGDLRCAGILDSWSLEVGRIPGTTLDWRLHGRRVFGKGLLWDGTDESVISWLAGVSRQLRGHGWAGLMIEALALDSPLWALIESTLGGQSVGLNLVRPQNLQPRWRLKLPNTVEEYWTVQFKGKTRNTLRRKRKKLGNYRVDVITEPAEVDEFLVSASAVSEHTWQSRELGLRVKNNQRERQLFRALAARGEFRGHLMRLDDRPVAFFINTSHDGCLHCEETGFLPEFLHLSPGTVLVSELVDDVIGCGQYHTLDFGLGHADYKQLFSNEQTESSNIWLLRNSPVNVFAAGMISAQESIRGSAKQALLRSGVLRHLKKLKRGH